ncbi:Mariner Mos1 transposase [Acromyrmex echinatior]|uniref:Mariner Mos1 transposase n=1 Tax=Acromyrmex echinatior TaxID=103372 RepID=F4W4D0_ACREC|nr:Mariner Mos1 transposase [Acromyrmex echinatior]
MLNLWLRGPIRIQCRLSDQQIKNLNKRMLALKKYVCAKFVTVIHNSNRTSLSNVQIFLILVSLTMIIIRKTKKILEIYKMRKFHTRIFNINKSKTKKDSYDRWKISRKIIIFNDNLDMLLENSPTPLTVFSRIAPSDYHLFRSMAHGLADQHFRSYEEVQKIGSIRGSPQKMTSFFDAGFVRCPKDGRESSSSDGQYFES